LTAPTNVFQPSIALSPDVPEDVTPRTAELVVEHQNRIYAQTSRLFTILMVVQWIAGIAAALWISPLAWAGATSSIHLHVWLAIFLGGAITSLPVFLTLVRPTEAFTRHTVAVCQMLMSSLLIHLSGGRIETHFHVFGSLAFLAFYRDWRELSAVGFRHPHREPLALGGACMLGGLRGHHPGQDVHPGRAGDVGNRHAPGFH
jgi:hypothetical protein